MNVVQNHESAAAPKLKLKNYYLGCHGILGKIGRTNTDVNNRLVNNYPRYISDMSTGFFLVNR